MTLANISPTIRTDVVAATRTHGAERPLARAEAWRMLASGRYVVVDAFADGARYYLAFAPAETAEGLLTARETQVAAYVAVGYPLKTAAFALDVSVATAGRTCLVALKKLGLEDRIQLARHWGSLLAASSDGAEGSHGSAVTAA